MSSRRNKQDDKAVLMAAGVGGLLLILSQLFLNPTVVNTATQIAGSCCGR